MSNEIIVKNLIHKGAEASLFYGYWFGKEAVFKKRIPKEYRIKEIDNMICFNRTLNEAKALIKVKNYGVLVPPVYEIDTENFTIVMKYIEGKKLKDILFSLTPQKKKQYLKEIGKSIAYLHKNGHIHGDITTSNIILTPAQDLFLVDFGLHDYSDTIEDKSTDLHLFKKVLISSHGSDSSICFGAFLEGYSEGYGKKNINEYNDVIKNISIIETRGRYVKKENRL